MSTIYHKLNHHPIQPRSCEQSPISLSLSQTTFSFTFQRFPHPGLNGNEAGLFQVPDVLLDVWIALQPLQNSLRGFCIHHHDGAYKGPLLTCRRVPLKDRPCITMLSFKPHTLIGDGGNRAHWLLSCRKERRRNASKKWGMGQKGFSYRPRRRSPRCGDGQNSVNASAEWQADGQATGGGEC